MKTMHESFICPTCGETHTALQSSDILLSNVRMDVFGCAICGTMWRVYSKVEEVNVEILSAPPISSEEVTIPDQETNFEVSEDA